MCSWYWSGEKHMKCRKHDFSCVIIPMSKNLQWPLIILRINSSNPPPRPQAHRLYGSEWRFVGLLLLSWSGLASATWALSSSLYLLCPSTGATLLAKNIFPYLLSGFILILWPWINCFLSGSHSLTLVSTDCTLACLFSPFTALTKILYYPVYLSVSLFIVWFWFLDFRLCQGQDLVFLIVVFPSRIYTVDIQ